MYIYIYKHVYYPGLVALEVQRGDEPMILDYSIYYNIV